MYVRWPQKAPFLIPPATPKVPFAPDGVPVIHPPPVTKSSPGQTGPPQVISACAEEITTFATPSTSTCSALTLISPVLPLAELFCSLMITRPIGKGIVWLGCPETTIDCPLITRSTISELPLTDAVPFWHSAVALA